MSFVVDREGLAWAAGFVDGEGHFRVGPDGCPRFQIAQVDRGPLDRLIGVVGLGEVGGPYSKLNENWADIHYLQITGYEKVQHVVTVLWEFMCEPKREQSFNTLKTCKKPLRRKGGCNAGHRMSEVGLIDNRCAACYLVKHPRSKMQPEFKE